MNGPDFDAVFVSQLDELFRWRRDVRRFKPDAIPAACLDWLLEMANLAPSVGLSQPWRFVLVDDPARRAAVRADFEACNTRALAAQDLDRAPRYARLKLAGLDEAPCQLAVFAESEPEQGHGLGRATMPETTTYSAVMAIHTLWLAARAVKLGLGWVSILDPNWSRGFWMCRPAGSSSATSVSATRRPKPKRPSWSASAGRYAARRARLSSAADRPCNANG